MPLFTQRPNTVSTPAAPSGINTNLPYADYGYVPGIAQTAQNTVAPAPELNPQPYFSTDQLAHANWFTTRVHLAPLGKAMKP